MRADPVHLVYTLTFEAPFHMGTGLRGGLVHRAVARDSDGLLYVPGSTLKGICRERCEQIARLFELQTSNPHDPGAALAEFGSGIGICELVFGSRTCPGGLCFDDALLSEEDRGLFEYGGGPLEKRFKAAQVEPRARVGLSRVTGAARRGLLFSSEYGLKGLRFKGVVCGTLPGVPVDPDTDITFTFVLLTAGLLAIGKIGGERSCGVGTLSISVDKLCLRGQARDPEEVLGRLGDLEWHDVFLAEERART